MYDFETCNATGKYDKHRGQAVRCNHHSITSKPVSSYTFDRNLSLVYRQQHANAEGS